MSDTLNDWISKAIPEGSGRYYALLHSDEQLQSQQQLVVTLISIFSTLGFQSREIEVAKHKLNWWRIELEKDSFQHPVMAALESPSRLTLNRLQNLLNAYGSLLENGSPSTEQTNLQFHMDTGANACQLLCNTDSDIEAVNKVGNVLSQLRCYRYLRPHVDHGLLCLPLASLDAANISPALLSADNTDKEVADFLKTEQNQLIQNLDDAIHSLGVCVSESPAQSKSQYKSLYIYARLQHTLLRSMAKDNTSVLNEVNRLTPINNYWTALRAAWKFDRF